jgi:hypothetical protein
MERLTKDREALDFIVSRIADEARRDGAPLSEIERKMLYFSETAWTLPDIMDVNDEFDKKYDQDAYEKRISQLIKKVISRARKQNPEEFKAWIEAIRHLRKEDRYLLVMVDQARVGSVFRPSRPPWDLLKLWGTGITVVTLFASLVWFINKLFPDKNLPPDTKGLLAFAYWLALVCVIALYSLLRFLIGARRFDDMSARALEWIFGVSRRSRKNRSA